MNRIIFYSSMKHTISLYYLYGRPDGKIKQSHNKNCLVYSGKIASRPNKMNNINLFYYSKMMVDFI